MGVASWLLDRSATEDSTAQHLDDTLVPWTYLFLDTVRVHDSRGPKIDNG